MMKEDKDRKRCGRDHGINVGFVGGYTYLVERLAVVEVKCEIEAEGVRNIGAGAWQAMPEGIVARAVAAGRRH